MKHVILTIALFLSAMTAQAQATPEMKKDVADIRKMYAEAKQEMEGLDKMEREGLMSMDCGFASRLSTELINAFDIVRNRNWD